MDLFFHPIQGTRTGVAGPEGNLRGELAWHRAWKDEFDHVRSRIPRIPRDFVRTIDRRYRTDRIGTKVAITLGSCWIIGVP